MNGNGKAGSDFSASIVKGSIGPARPVMGAARARGLWRVECFGADRTLKWTDDFENLVVNEGLDHLLDVTLSGATQDTTWFVGLTDSAPTIAAADTLVTHTGWVEETGYTGTRQAWTDGGVSAQSVDNSASKASFAITGTATIGGAFLCGVTSGTAGTLYAVGAFSGGDRSVVNGDTLEVTATFTMADDGV